MRSLRSLIDPGGRSLAYHVERLRRSLQSLGQRLRDGVAQAVGEAVAGAVADAVQALLDRLAGAPDLRGVPDRPAPPWGMPDEAGWADEPDGLFPGPAEGLDGSPESGPQPAGTRPARWLPALAVSGQAVAWWLRRRPGRLALLAAVGVGLACALAAGAAGPALPLAALAGWVRCGAAALARLTAT
jgi:hypothetical protein